MHKCSIYRIGDSDLFTNSISETQSRRRESDVFDEGLFCFHEHGEYARLIVFSFTWTTNNCCYVLPTLHT